METEGRALLTPKIRAGLSSCFENHRHRRQEVLGSLVTNLHHLTDTTLRDSAAFSASAVEGYALGSALAVRFCNPLQSVLLPLAECCFMLGSLAGHAARVRGKR